MRTRQRRKRSGATPLHVRFGRGYQVGIFVGLVLGAGVWWSTQSGLDRVEAEEAQARLASEVVSEVDAVGQLLVQIEDSPNSLSLRSDLAREVSDLEGHWDSLLSADDLPEGVQVQVEGPNGVNTDLETFARDATALASLGAEGIEALSQIDTIEARRLRFQVNSLAERLKLVVGVYQDQADQAIAGMREVSNLAALSSLVFLFLLVFVLLRPLKHLLRNESGALKAANQAHRDEASRQELAAHLSDGLEAAESEEETHRVVTRAFEQLVPDAPIELLLADSARGELKPAVLHPHHGGPGCEVDSPWSCPAVRRGRTMNYDDSGAVNACPHLADRRAGDLSATCVPLSFMGESMGVLHTTGPVGAEPDRAMVDVLGLVASQVSVRIGTLRSFAQVELQASTDSLTGLPNRRATEDRLERMLRTEEVGAVAMADLDRFKHLNDKYGHEAGDRALRMFADAVREALRDQDWIGRWGGEEFVLALPGLAATQAKDALDRVREHLADACVRAEAPAVTVSIGVVDMTHGAHADELVRLADEALLVAKTQGRDRVIAGPVVAPLATESGLSDVAGEL